MAVVRPTGYVASWTRSFNNLPREFKSHFIRHSMSFGLPKDMRSWAELLRTFQRRQRKYGLKRLGMDVEETFARAGSPALKDL